VVGLGNPCRGDDGVGPAVLRALRGGDGLRVTRDEFSKCFSRVNRHASPVTGSPITRHPSRVTDFLEVIHDGFRLAEAICDYERVLIVDAAPWLPPGEVQRFPLEDLPARAGYLHGLGLGAALEALAMAGERVPEVEVLAIGIPEDPQFGEGLSRKVERALPRALAEVSEWLNGC